MNILVDENIPLEVVRQLRQMGHQVLDIRGSQDEGMTDQALWAKAQQEECLLVTTDRGFGYFRDQQHRGILIISLRQPNRHIDP